MQDVVVIDHFNCAGPFNDKRSAAEYSLLVDGWKTVKLMSPIECLKWLESPPNEH